MTYHLHATRELPIPHHQCFLTILLEIEKNPKYKILIKSHKKIAVQKVIRLIEEVRLAGTDNIKLINLEK